MSPSAVTVELIVEAVSAVFGVPVRDIHYRHQRNARASEARHVAMYLSCQTQAMPLQAIALALSLTNHTSVSHGRDKVTDRLRAEPDFAARVAYAGRLAEEFALHPDQHRQPVDAVQAAERVILGDPIDRAAMSVSVDEMVAIATRLCALEEVAATTYRLLALLDEHHRLLKRPFDGRAGARRAQIAASAAALSDAIAEALQGLGYEYAEPADEPTSEPKDETDGQAHQGGGPATPRAAE